MEMIRKYFMPFTTGASCIIDPDCPPAVFPATAATCECEFAVGGINELYFIPCTETMSEANVGSVAWWQGLVDGNLIGRSGAGLGSVGKKATKLIRVASCRIEQLVSITWALKFTIRCFDKTSARTTCGKMNELIRNFNKYLVIARMCEGDEQVLPIGVFTTSDFDWVVPDNFEDEQNVNFELSWKELGFPCTVDVPGINAAVPKLS